MRAIAQGKERREFAPGLRGIVAPGPRRGAASHRVAVHRAGVSVSVPAASLVYSGTMPQNELHKLYFYTAALCPPWAWKDSGDPFPPTLAVEPLDHLLLLAARPAVASSPGPDTSASTPTLKADSIAASPGPGEELFTLPEERTTVRGKRV